MQKTVSKVYSLNYFYLFISYFWVITVHLPKYAVVCFLEQFCTRKKYYFCFICYLLAVTTIYIHIFKFSVLLRLHIFCLCYLKQRDPRRRRDSEYGRRSGRYGNRSRSRSFSRSRSGSWTGSETGSSRGSSRSRSGSRSMSGSRSRSRSWSSDEGSRSPSVRHNNRRDNRREETHR